MASLPVQDEVIKYIKDLYQHLSAFMQFTVRYNTARNEKFGTSLELKRSSSELVNIRDIFMHFILYCEAEESKNSEKALEQWCYINEHGQRAVKDQFVFFCQNILVEDLQEWLKKLELNGQYPHVAKATRVLLHDVKNTVFRIRISSANGIRITDQRLKISIKKLSEKHIQYQNEYYSIIKEVCYSNISN